jgi:hypothetical protein
MLNAVCGSCFGSDSKAAAFMSACCFRSFRRSAVLLGAFLTLRLVFFTAFFLGFFAGFFFVLAVAWGFLVRLADARPVCALGRLAGFAASVA